MEIIAGFAKGMTLTVPDGVGVRPTSVRARKALFDSLGSFTGTKIVDLFAGSGAIGLEAISRGAKQVVCIEQNPTHCKAIVQNIQKMHKAIDNASIECINSDALAPCCYTGSIHAPDIIFADPPYIDSGVFYSQLTSDECFSKWANNALLIWELPDDTHAREPFFNTRSEWRPVRTRKFGKTGFIFVRKTK